MDYLSPALTHCLPCGSAQKVKQAPCGVEGCWLAPEETQLGEVSVRSGGRRPSACLSLQLMVTAQCSKGIGPPLPCKLEQESSRRQSAQGARTEAQHSFPPGYLWGPAMLQREECQKGEKEEIGVPFPGLASSDLLRGYISQQKNCTKSLHLQSFLCDVWGGVDSVVNK